MTWQALHTRRIAVWACMLFLASCSTTPPPTPASGQKIKVVTTVAPITSIVKNVGGTRIDLQGIIPDGTDSHTFEPAPSDAQILASADLIIVNGLNLEVPTEKLAQTSLKRGATIVRLGDNTITRDDWVFDFSFPKDHGDPNPHLWMNVTYAMRYAEIVRDTLSTADPAGKQYYAKNTEVYLAKLKQLDEAIMQAVQTIPAQQRKLVTYHDSWAYFARRYGMQVIGAAQPSDFAEPSPQDMARMIDQLRAERVPALFGSEVFPSRVLEQIAKEAGVKYIDALRDDDPPGKPGDSNHTYIGMILFNMETMVPALGGSATAFQGIDPADSYSR